LLPIQAIVSRTPEVGCTRFWRLAAIRLLIGWQWLQATLGVAVDGSGNVFVADPGNGAVYEVLAAGGYATVNTLGSGFGAWGIAVDRSGNVSSPIPATVRSKR